MLQGIYPSNKCITHKMLVLTILCAKPKTMAHKYLPLDVKVQRGVLLGLRNPRPRLVPINLRSATSRRDLGLTWSIKIRPGSSDPVRSAADRPWFGVESGRKSALVWSRSFSVCNPLLRREESPDVVVLSPVSPYRSTRFGHH